MKSISILKKTAVGLIAAALVSLVALGNTSYARPYDPNDPGYNHPVFNTYTGTPYNGDEPDFFRGKVAGDTGNSVDPLNTACQDGKEFTLRVYVHNNANTIYNDNGNGPGVAHNTKVVVNLPSAQNSSFKMNSTISASTAGSVSDGMTINCTDGSQYQLSYVPGSAQQWTKPSGTQALSDSIVTTGAKIGTFSPNGDVWGCWDQRVFVTLNVKITKKVVPPESSGICKVLSLQVINKEEREINVNVDGEVSNAQIIGYKIDFGDGTVVAQQSANHKYASDGTYNIKGYVNVKLADGSTQWKTASSCESQITFKHGVPPKTPPQTPPSTVVSSLPNTGPGNVIAAFFGVTSISSALYYAVSRRLAKLF
jgi:hypothetical protein